MLMINRLNKLRKLLGYEWRGPWQNRAAEHICRHRYTTFQGPRQFTGKSWLASLVAVSYLLEGKSVIVAFPTLRTGSKVLIESIEGMMDRLEALLGPDRLRRTTDNVMYKRWDNGGRLYLISSDESAQVEGLTADMIIWDEAHNSQPARLAQIMPFIAVADKEGTARIILLGIGGSRGSLLSTMKRSGVYAPCVITPEELCQFDPDYERLLRQYKLTLGDLQYRQHFGMEDVEEGERYLFPRILERTDSLRDWAPARAFCIDVGRHSDDTVIGVFERRPTTWTENDGQQHYAIDLVRIIKIPRVSFADWYETPAGDKLSGVDLKEYTGQVVRHKGQAHLIYDAIQEYKPANGWIDPETIRMERNAVGEGLFDILEAEYYPGLVAVYMTNEHKNPLGDGVKDQAIGKARALARAGLLAVDDEKARAELLGLKYEIKEDGQGRAKLDTDHSDILSVLLLGVTAW